MRIHARERRRQRHISRAAVVLAPTSSVAMMLLFGAGLARADAPDTLWTGTYGGTNIDVAYDVRQAVDGGFAVAGYTRSYGAGGHDVWLFKTDPSGGLEWSSAFGGSSDDEGQALCRTSDGGYAVAGFTQSYGAGGKDVWLLKTNASGVQDWARTFGGPSDDEAYAVQETVDGGLVIAGATTSYGAGSRDMWVIRTDGSGTLAWSRTFGGFGSDGAWAVSETSDHGFILAGWTFSYGPGAVGNAWLVKADSLGTMEWNRAFGGTDADRGYAVRQTMDGGYIMAGYTGSFGAGLYDLYLVKTDDDGIEQWSRAFGGSGRDYANSVVQTIDGGYLAAGYTLSYGAGGDDMYLVRTDAAGTLEWSATYGGTASDVAYAVANTSDGGYVVAGHTLSSGAGLHDARVIRLEPEDVVAVTASVTSPGVRVDVRPSPFARTATIGYAAPPATTARVHIHDAGGRLVRILQGGPAGAGAGALVWDGIDEGGRRVPPGIYFCRLEAGGFESAFRMVRVND